MFGEPADQHAVVSFVQVRNVMFRTKEPRTKVTCGV